jgi:hypothetical protein
MEREELNFKINIWSVPQNFNCHIKYLMTQFFTKDVSDRICTSSVDNKTSLHPSLVESFKIMFVFQGKKTKHIYMYHTVGK